MILVLGSGVAGLACALAAVRAGAEAMLVTPGAFDSETRRASAAAGGNTALAQGGIAASIGEADTPEQHAADTVAAGAGLVDAVAARCLTSDGAAAVRSLLTGGFPVDRDAGGAPMLGLEAAHGRRRIVHAGEDRTGAALHAYLSEQVLRLAAEGRLRIVANTRAVSLLGDPSAASGAVLRDEQGRLSAVRAEAVVIATGGFAALYPDSSNHAGARGEGIVLAARLGAVLADLEFVQFHPTVLAGTGLLISEAVRGAGAVLRDGSGARFMLDAHQAAELAPRDVVSLAMHRIMRERGESTVWLDATEVAAEQGSERFIRRFPALTAATRGHGYDWTREAVPVAPAAHYTMGGIVTDLDGRTSVTGLFAAGEAASTGVHGANRLASNSLLEGLVFGSRAGRAAAAYARRPEEGAEHWRKGRTDAASLIARASTIPGHELPVAHDASTARFSHEAAAAASAGADASSDAVDTIDPTEELAMRAEFARGIGIERDADGLRSVRSLAESRPGMAAELIRMVAVAAEARTESRGAHQRSDQPRTDARQAVRRSWRLAGAASSPSGEAADPGARGGGLVPAGAEERPGATAPQAHDGRRMPIC